MGREGRRDLFHILEGPPSTILGLLGWRRVHEKVVDWWSASNSGWWWNRSGNCRTRWDGIHRNLSRWGCMRQSCLRGKGTRGGCTPSPRACQPSRQQLWVSHIRSGAKSENALRNGVLPCHEPRPVGVQ
ncbi:hypothetical protein O6H91_Y341100 [Diphasiastrum complanatum]|nr:hypothetical protein O6H91_Y341100 [Diphasiastrum complanatum]